ncbi:glycosyl hydrolase family 61-domain-containing protein [Lipomyces arxii]|uniref:glycosyl hydrolase family 61-domain-containing protein n=1 Tax=Lipomyces arxii TaxID=56418 RepID=UPI0034CF81CD
MLLALYFLLGLLCSQVYGHGYISNFWNPTQQPKGDCIRPYIDFMHVKNPITDKMSREMTCGHLPGAAKAPDRTCSVAKAGDKVALEWTVMWGAHLGPVIVYMATEESMGEGDAWWKVYYDGYNPEKKRWATSDLWANDGLLWFKIPSYLPAGGYIIRGEVIALHNASYIDGAQFYENCVHINIEESDKADSVDVAAIPKVAFPGYYTDDTPGLHIDIWTQSLEHYPVIGPPMYTPGNQVEFTGTTVAVESTMFLDFTSSETPFIVMGTSTATNEMSEVTSTSSDASSATSTAIRSTGSNNVSKSLTAVFPDLTCSTAVGSNAVLMSASESVTMDHVDPPGITGGASTATLTITPSPVTVYATVTDYVYTTASVTAVVTVTQLDIAYARREL